MPAASKTSVVTFNEFCRVVPEGQKADLIEGIIYIAPPEVPATNQIAGWLLILLGVLARQQDLGNVYFARVTFRLDDQNAPEPDIGFIRKERRHLVKPQWVEGSPDLAMEIVSPDSVDRDYGMKRFQYERFGVPEYWIVDELDEKVTLLRLQSNGRYREVRPKKGVLHSQMLPGFYLRPEWCWQEPLPNAFELLQELLGGCGNF